MEGGGWYREGYVALSDVEFHYIGVAGVCQTYHRKHVGAIRCRSQRVLIRQVGDERGCAAIGLQLAGWREWLSHLSQISQIMIDD
jgi:hypothetical protein